VRLRRRYLAIPVFLMMLVALLIVRFNAANLPSPQGAALSLSPLYHEGEPLAGVYNPSRFRVLSDCKLGSGVVGSVNLLCDGGRRVDVSVDSKCAGLLDTGSTIYQNGLLVVELLPQDQASIPVPSVGQQITFAGSLVYDTTNGWNAIYPVWSNQAA
jgi:hypothetical protein